MDRQKIGRGEADILPLQRYKNLVIYFDAKVDLTIKPSR